MSELSSIGMNRRQLLGGAAALLGASTAPSCLGSVVSPSVAMPDTRAIKQASRHTGIPLSMFTVAGQIHYDPPAASIIASTFAGIADGNDLKFSDRLRPTPDTFDFTLSDAAVNWATQHGLTVRGHCLVWWNALPKWFTGYVTPQNGKQVMTSHITKVVGHYAGRMEAWDVVNEVIYDDKFMKRPDGQRVKPWLTLAGEDYIEVAFRAAHAADPKAHLLINECYIEHTIPNEQHRRASLLALVTKLKKNNVPITTVGVQGHLRGATPIDRPGMTDFCSRVRDLGLGIRITELDVDTIQVPAQQAASAVSGRYAEFLDVMAPFVEAITFEQLYDAPDAPKNADGTITRPNLFDAHYQPTANYAAAVKSLNATPANGRTLPRASKGEQ